MKLTDEKILELKNNARREWNYRADQYNQWDELGRDEQDLEFARAILKEAGVEEYEPVAWMSDSEHRLFSYGHSAFVSTYSEPVRSDGIVLYKKSK